jgi:HAD superfamily hydrolase (TIGR01549 family)
MGAITLLLDLDGTVWDSYPWYAASLRAGSELSAQEIVERLRAGENVIRLAREFGLSNSRFRSMCAQSVAELRLYPDVSRVLCSLDRRHIPMGVVTNLPKWLVEPSLRSFGMMHHFATCEYAAGKPSPTGLLKALAGMNQQPEPRVFFVGDSEADATAASRAGISFAWASYGYTKDRPSSASFVLDSFSDLLKI